VTIDITKLPRLTLGAGTVLYRIHRRIHGPWFFDDSGAGRFDPVHVSGRGTCYWAEEPLGAWVEVFRTRMLLPEPELDARWLTVATLASDMNVLDLCDRRGIAAGATAALTAGSDYSDAQLLASAAQGAASGARWRVRHDLGQELIGLAIFGPAGALAQADMAAFATTHAQPIPPLLVAEAEREFGYRVLPGSPASA
jgi:hypothetical protein